MKHTMTRLGLLTWALAGAAQGVWAQANPPPASPTAAAPDPCRQDVSKFEQAIGFVRQTQGTAAAGALKEKLLPAKTEADILFKDGYCGLSKYLRDKKLI